MCEFFLIIILLIEAGHDMGAVTAMPIWMRFSRAFASAFRFMHKWKLTAYVLSMDRRINEGANDWHCKLESGEWIEHRFHEKRSEWMNLRSVASNLHDSIFSLSDREINLNDFIFVER